MYRCPNAGTAASPAIGAAIWFTFRPAGPELGVDATIIIVIGSISLRQPQSCGR